LTAPSYFLYDAVEMAAGPSLGEFEQVVLLAILRLRDNAYGVTIAAEITACTNRKPAPGALYTTLDRLEDKGLITSRLGEPTPNAEEERSAILRSTRRVLQRSRARNNPIDGY
jgi:PadR family transcriptional regulator, regulatory protein PadR